jgi:hypothetical protein
VHEVDASVRWVCGTELVNVDRSVRPAHGVDMLVGPSDLSHAWLDYVVLLVDFTLFPR